MLSDLLLDINDFYLFYFDLPLHSYSFQPPFSTSTMGKKGCNVSVKFIKKKKRKKQT